MKAGTVEVEINLLNKFSNKFDQVLDKAESGAGESGRKAGEDYAKQAAEGAKAEGKKTQSILKGLFKYDMIKGAVSAAFDIGKSAFSMASDLEETQNVVDTAFGSMSGMCEDFAKTALSSFGLSETSAKKMSSTYMSMASGIGVSGDAAAKMSINLTKLAADTASFYNLSADDAAKKLESVFTGETESLKSLGVVMSQTNLQNYAMQNGMSANLQTMSEAEKTALRYSFVMDSLSLAQGDFSKTSDSAANSMKLAQESIDASLTSLGTVAIQALAPAISWIAKFAATVANYAKAIADMIGGLFGKGKSQNKPQSSGQAAAVQQETQQIVDATVDQGNRVAAAKKKAAKKANNGVAGFDEVNIVGSKQDDNGGDAGTAGGGGVAAGAPIAVPDYGALGGDIDVGFDVDTSGLETAKQNITSWVNTAKGMFGGLSSWVQRTFWNGEGLNFDLKKPIDTAVKTAKPAFDRYKASFGPLGEAAKKAGQTIQNHLSDVKPKWDKIGGEFGEQVGRLAGIAGMIAFDIGTSINNFLTNHLQPLSEGIGALLDGVTEFCAIVWDNIKPVIDNILERLVGIWESHLKPCLDAFLDMCGKIVEVVLMVWNTAIQPVINYLADLLMPIIREIANFFVNIFANAISMIVDVFTNLFNIVGDVCDIIMGICSGDWSKVSEAWDKLAEDILGIFTGLWDNLMNMVDDVKKDFDNFMKTVMRAIIKPFEDLWNTVSPFFSDVWNSIVKTANEWCGSVGKFFDNVVGSITGAFSGMWDGVTGFFGDMWGNITGTADGWTGDAGGIFGGVKDSITGAFGGLWEGAQGAFDGLCDGIRQVPGGKEMLAAIDTFGSIKDQTVDAIGDIWSGEGSVEEKWNATVGVVEKAASVFMDTLKDIFSGPIDTIKGFFEGLKTNIEKIFNDIKDAVKGPINTVIDCINGMISGVNGISFDFMGQKIGFDIPLIPKLAKGGVLSQPTLNIAGEAGPEAVVPLEKDGRLAQLIAAAVAQGLRSGGGGQQDMRPIEIVIQTMLDGKKIGENVVKYIRRQNRLEGRGVVNYG